MQKKIAITALLTILAVGIFYFQKTQTIEKIRSAGQYCKSVRANKGNIVQSITDCREYKIVYFDKCYDCGNSILDQDWNKIDSCGGLGGWSKECKEKYSINNSCINTTCKEVNQKEFERTYCTKNQDCTFAECACEAVNKKYSHGLACTINCEGTPRCINNKCTLVRN